MEKEFKRVEGAGSASIFKGDPRGAVSSIDLWFQGVLTRNSPSAEARPHLYGADAGLCARRNVLLANNTWLSSSVSATQNAYMSIGVALEDMLAEGLRRNNRLLAQNMYLPLIPEVKVRGKMDLVILDHEDEVALIEVKSCGKLPLEPRATHLAQLQTYVALSGLRRAYLTYISRSVELEFGKGLSVLSFLVDASSEALADRLRIALLSKAAIAARQLPPVPAHFKKHTECHYCEFRDHFCWATRPGRGGHSPGPKAFT